MDITEKRLAEVISSGRCVSIIQNSESRGFRIEDDAVPVEPYEDEDTVQASNIRIETVGIVGLSEDKLVVIIKDSHIIGTAVLTPDQHEYLIYSHYKSFDSYLYQKWSDEKYGG